MNSGYQRLQNDRGNTARYGATDPTAHSPGVVYARGSSAEFFQLCDKITTNLFTINKAATTLEKSKKLIGTSSDNQTLRDRITQVNSDGGNTIQDTTSFFRSVHGLTQGDKQRKIRVQRLQTEFQAAATRFSEIQMKIVNTVRTARLPSDMVASELDRETGVSDQLVKEGEQLHAKKEELQTLEFEVAMQQEREQRVRQLESDIININDIMKELSNIVSAQGNVVDTIESNIETAHGQVEEGREQLVRAAAYQNKSRKKLCILVLILVVILFIIAIILAIHFTNKN